MSNYNTYGVHISKTQPIIKKGDKVKYVANYRGTDGKLIYYDLIGVWDGEKVEFNDKDHYVVRTTWWLEKVASPSPYHRIRQYITTLYHRIVSTLILLKYKNLDEAKEKSFNYYLKNVHER